MTTPLKLLPSNFNPENPIPNNAFYSPPALYSQGPWFPFIVGTGFSFDYQTSTINATGGGGGSPATPTVVGSVLGCTVANWTALGCNALAVNTGVSNVAVGVSALFSNTTGCANVAVGLSALCATTTTCRNVAVGTYAGCEVTTGCQNTLMGHRAGQGITTGWSNSAFGYRALANVDTGTHNTAIGPFSGSALTTESCNVIIGAYDGTLLLGCDCGVVISDNDTASFTNVKVVWNRNAAMDPAGTGNYGNTGDVLTAQGAGAPPIWAPAGGGSYATPTTYGSVLGCTTSDTTSLGCDALLANTGPLNVAVGYNSLGSNTSGAYNTAVGSATAPNLTTGNQNLVVGFSAGNALTVESGNLILGAVAGEAGFNDNIFIGNGVGSVIGLRINASGAWSPYNTGVNLNTPEYGTAGQVLVSCGNAASPQWASSADISIPAATPSTLGTVYGTTEFRGNVGLGRYVLYGTTAASRYNTALGNESMIGNTDGGYNTAVGAFSLRSNTTGGYNVGTGYDVLSLNTTGSYNTATGYRSLSANTTGCYNVASGLNSLQTNDTGTHNSAYGVGALGASVSGNCNSAFGWASLGNSSTGEGNTAVGVKSLFCNLSGNYNTAAGKCSLFNVLGSNNIGFGYEAGCNIDTGDNNIVVGFSSGVCLTNESGNTIVGQHPGEATYNNNIYLANGAGTVLGLRINASGAWSPYNTGVDLVTPEYGTAGQVLVSCGNAAAPQWGSPAAATPTALGTVYGCTNAYLTALGCNAALNTDSTYNTYNTVIGTNAHCSNTGGDCYVAIGYDAAKSITSSYDNTVIGAFALCCSTTGSGNVVIGTSAAVYATDLSYSAIVGRCSGICLNVACGMTLLGEYALQSQTDGEDIIAIGKCAAECMVTGSCNTFLGGYNAAGLDGCSSHVAISSGENDTTGIKVIWDGGGAMSPGGVSNFGNAGEVLTSQGAGVAPIWSTGTAATPTTLGMVYGCMDTNYNTALGYCALQAGGANGGNVAVGGLALYNTTGKNNVAIGVEAMELNTTGCSNVALGDCAGFRISTGSYNTVLGHTTGECITTGCGNIAIGGWGSGGVSNPVYEITTENDYIAVGSAEVTNAYIQVPWTVVSDARDKIVEGSVPHGLDFVKQLEPKAFHFKENRDSIDPHGPLRYGFLAQDILALEGESSVIIDSNDPEKLRYNGEALVPVLVNAIKELEARVSQLETNS